MKIILIRHGETAQNAPGIMMDRLNAPLSNDQQSSSFRIALSKNHARHS